MKAVHSIVRAMALGAMMAFAGSAVAQQAYPGKPIRFIVPYPGGAANDMVARLIGQKLTESWGQQVLVDNRAGGNGIIGTDAVAKSKPDGYTILLVVLSHIIIPQLVPTPYDAIKDFAAVATISTSELILLVHPSVPASNLQEFISLAKSKPGELNFGSGGAGTSGHFPAELLSNQAGIRMQHVPYKGGGPALVGLLAGQVQVLFASAMGTLPYIKNGKLKPIAITRDTRLAILPEVPTFAETGLPGVEAKTWLGILAPAGTPKEIINKMSADVAKILAAPDVRENLLKQGNEPFISSPDEFAALMKADMAKYGNIIKTANIKLEN